MPQTNNNVKLDTGSAEGDVSFASMKANTSVGDDMGYIPYVGMALVALAVLGILYFIVATITQRRSRKPQTQRAYAGGYADSRTPAYQETRTTTNAENRTPSAEDFKRENLSKSRAKGSKGRYADDYADGYSATRRGAKADTGEINLPRRFK